MGPGAMSSGQLKVRARRALIAHVRATQPNCHLCGLPIDLTRDAQRDPLASCVDELVPRSRGGSALDLTNVGHAHRICNGSRGAKPITPEVRARCRALMSKLQAPVTVRDW